MRVVGEMKEVLVRIACNPSVFQIIDIVVADIPDAYGLFFSRDWSRQLNGFFDTYWSTLWLPKNGKSNQIKINRERYLKHTVIELHDPSESILFSDSIMGNYMYELGFGNFKIENFVFSDNKHQSEILNVTTISHDSSFKEIVNDVDSHNIVNIIESKVVVNSSTWTLYFDGSKSKGAGAGFLLIDTK